MKCIFVIFLVVVASINHVSATDLSAGLAEQDLKIEAGKGCFTGQCSWEEANTWSFDRSKVTEDAWRKQRALDLQDISKLAVDMSADKYTNFAMFRMQMFVKAREPVTLFDCQDTVFASGVDKKFLGDLGSKLGNKKFVCSADYWTQHPDQQEDHDFRRNIAEIMGFNEVLTDTAKRLICAMFQSRIVRRDYLEEVDLNDSAVLKLVSSCRSSLSNVFDETSDRLAHKLGLVDKSGKTECDWHVNDLFGEAFQLNFAHSAQAILQFISCLDSSSTSPSEVKSFLQFDEKFLLKVTSYKNKYDANVRAGCKQEPEDLKQISAELDKYFLIHLKKSGVKFTIEIASCYEMCSNCWATFRCEFLRVGEIQKKFLLLMIRSDEGIPDDLKWYISERLSKFDLSKNIPPIVSLLVSHHANVGRD